MKKVLLLFLVTPFLIYSGTTGKLGGTIKDAQTGEALVGANIIIEGTNFGAATNIEGEFFILNISPGKYNIKFSFIGYETVLMKDVVITVDQTTFLDVKLNSQVYQVDEIVVTARTPLIQKDVTSSISVITQRRN